MAMRAQLSTRPGREGQKHSELGTDLWPKDSVLWAHHGDVQVARLELCSWVCTCGCSCRSWVNDWHLPRSLLLFETRSLAVPEAQGFG